MHIYKHLYHFITQMNLYNGHLIITIMDIQHHDHWHVSKILSNLNRSEKHMPKKDNGHISK